MLATIPLFNLHNLEIKQSLKAIPNKSINISSTVKRKKRRSQNKSSINYKDGKKVFKLLLSLVPNPSMPLSSMTAKKIKTYDL